MAPTSKCGQRLLGRLLRVWCLLPHLSSLTLLGLLHSYVLWAARLASSGGKQGKLQAVHQVYYSIFLIRDLILNLPSIVSARTLGLDKHNNFIIIHTKVGFRFFLRSPQMQTRVGTIATGVRENKDEVNGKLSNQTNKPNR